MSCHLCGGVTPNIYRLCDECRTSSSAEERAGQGLPALVTDPVMNALVAHLLFRKEGNAA